MIKEGYQSKDTLATRIKAMEDWLANPELLRADADAEYAAVIEINMDDIKEPVLCAPNDPDDARTLSAVAGASIDEVFIGSCMTNIGHYRAAATILEKCKNQLPVKLWIAPPTKMDRAEIIHEGLYSIFGKVGTRCEIPGCSLCMGNQARVADNSTVISTSTRNFPNRLGQGANVYLASAELATVASVLGHIPTKEEYLEGVKVLSGKESSIYSYLKFNEMTDYNV